MLVECRWRCATQLRMRSRGGHRSARGRRRLREQRIHNRGQLVRRRDSIDGWQLRLGVTSDVGALRCSQLCVIIGLPSTLGLYAQHSLFSRGIRRLGCRCDARGVTQQICGAGRQVNLVNGGSRQMSGRGDGRRRELKGDKDLWICACSYRAFPCDITISRCLHLLVKIHFCLTSKTYNQIFDVVIETSPSCFYDISISYLIAQASSLWQQDIGIGLRGCISYPSQSLHWLSSIS